MTEWLTLAACVAIGAIVLLLVYCLVQPDRKDESVYVLPALLILGVVILAGYVWTCLRCWLGDQVMPVEDDEV